MGRNITQMQICQSPMVSIIMTTYNVKDHIQESLNSVLGQSLEHIEVLCVDGNSTDGTIDIIRSYHKKDPRVKLFFQERPGIGAAKNCGIENASGKYITFLDADDFYVSPFALESMYQCCEDEGVRVCGALRSTLFMDGRVDREPLHRNDCKVGGKPVRLQYLDKQYDYHFHSYLYDRKMVINSDARFAEVKAYDDTHFFIRAMLVAKEFCVVPVELYRYRCGPAYDWGMEKANDAICTLTDQLRLTKKNNLATLHWLTLQRINYEYGPIFEKNVRAGDFDLLERLVEANKEVDPSLIRQVEADPPSEEWYLEPMMHRRFDDSPLRKSTGRFSPEYILEPLWNLMHPRESSVDELQNELNFLRERVAELEQKRQGTKRYGMAFWKKKFRGGLMCLKEHGFTYTVCHGIRKVKIFMHRRKQNGKSEG